ncbi:uncharacterized protein Z518_01370 [Rhinocladiella mackenziei CBS 650.93]|uniref:F-box domain-containing protein n=1 Tax=Rhinocladiella mackenziei CBS 650.93 TaxID=1442369 RepID=A0A0D2HHW5_9EURO|nr:uncharacterized protein Z518_01370 [Rhinocladiella mackenziei CBS 650.93]KIX10288.1 hypothetical protein Z518_01370 [Rhinocladiella mackenziei CBS 650.93]
MKIGDPVYRGAERHLPVEVIGLISDYIASTHNLLTQRTLWACCLVSKAWYSVFVGMLYHHPLLSSRNFDKFARTICPPVNSRKRRIGLGNFVNQLDMSQLAYESSKSITARLLRRTRNSLTWFASPAVTFSIASLAPLSKCINLHLLDLSSDGYGIRLRLVLDTIGHLEHLAVLRLPRDSLNGRCDLGPNSRWPKNLSHLQITDWLFLGSQSWTTLIESWPKSLKTLKFEDCMQYADLQTLALCETRANYIRCLEIGLERKESWFPWTPVLSVFPQLKAIKFPAWTMRRQAFVGTQGTLLREFLKKIERDNLLEVLTFTPQQPEPTHPNNLPIDVLHSFVDKFPRLRRLEIAKKDLDTNVELPALERLGSVLELRATPGERESAGLFFLDD